jgi:hypothetical protein
MAWAECRDESVSSIVGRRGAGSGTDRGSGAEGRNAGFASGRRYMPPGVHQDEVAVEVTAGYLDRHS